MMRHNKACTIFILFRRAKSARVITFEQFNQALTELAAKRFKGKSQEEALQQLYGLLVGKEPANLGVTVSTSPHSLRPHEAAVFRDYCVPHLSTQPLLCYVRKNSDLVADMCRCGGPEPIYKPLVLI